jgi:YVTN family beta-propeller protein
MMSRRIRSDPRLVALTAFAVAAFIVLVAARFTAWERPAEQGVGIATVESSAAPASSATSRAESPSPRRPVQVVLPAGPDRPSWLGTRAVSVVTHPEGALVALSAVDGRLLAEGPAPWRGEVPAGYVDVEVRAEGRTTVERRLPGYGEARLELWLDPHDQAHRSLVRFSCGPNPKQVAFTPDGRELWVSLLGGHGLEVYSPLTGELLGRVDLGRYGAVEVIFTADGETAFASQMETASVFEIDRRSRSVRRRLPTQGAWTKVLALAPGERTLYAANWSSNDVSEIDLNTGEVRRRIPTVRTPRGLLPTPDGKTLFVAGYEDGQIQKLDLAGGEGKVLLETGGAMRHLVGDPATGRLYADDMATDEVYVVDLDTDRVTKLADTDEKPNTIDLGPGGRVLYVSNRGENGSNYYLPGPEWGSVLAIDTSSGAVLDAIVGGNQTTGLDVSADGRLLAFSDFLDNRIRVYEIPAYEVLRAAGGGRARTHLADLKK